MPHFILILKFEKGFWVVNEIKILKFEEDWNKL